MFPLIQGCKTLTRAEIDAITFHNNGPLPEHLCNTYPELWDYGFYRTIDSGGFEFLSWCNGNVTDYLTFKESDVNELIDETLPKGATANVDTQK